MLQKANIEKKIAGTRAIPAAILKIERNIKYFRKKTANGFPDRKSTNS